MPEKIINYKKIITVPGSSLPWNIIIRNQNQIKKISQRYKFKIVFKSRNNFSTAFRFRDDILKELASGVVFSVMVNV